MTRTMFVALVAMAMTLPLIGVAQAQQLGVDPSVEQENLTTELLTPTALAVAPDGRVIVTSREGQVTVWEQDGVLTRAAKLSVDAYDRSGGQFDEATRCDQQGPECPDGYNLAEGGIHGILLAPDFLESGELYLYYTVTASLGDDIWPPKMPDARPHCEGDACPGSPTNCPPGANCQADGNDEGKFRLSRFTLDLDTNELDLSSEVELFENPAEWFYCCHYGGDMEWRNDGTLLLSTGDDTTSDHSSGYSPHDTRPDWTFNSAVLTSQNKADRRGKVLRIDVAEIEAGRAAGLSLEEVWDNPDYDGVPAGNPFEDEVDADPYVYALGFRSNYRFAYNPVDDYLYVGTVGPDAQSPNPTRGPAAHDEIEVVPPGGGTNHGWPLCIANNLPYNEYDFETGTAGEPFSCAGMTPASIYYTYRPSNTSPWIQMGTGSNTAMGGEFYQRPETGALRLPVTFDRTLLWMEHGRGQMWKVPVTANGTLDTNPLSMTPVATGGLYLGNTLSNPIDSMVGPDGALYVLEGNGFWNSESGTLSRFKCAGCSPDAADYGPGVDVMDFGTDTLISGVDGGLATSLPAWALIGLLVAAAAAMGLRTRKEVI